MQLVVVGHATPCKPSEKPAGCADRFHELSGVERLTTSNGSTPGGDPTATQDPDTQEMPATSRFRPGAAPDADCWVHVDPPSVVDRNTWLPEVLEVAIAVQSVAEPHERPEIATMVLGNVVDDHCAHPSVVSSITTVDPVGAGSAATQLLADVHDR
jgi:hypothetical protein